MQMAAVQTLTSKGVMTQRLRTAALNRFSWATHVTQWQSPCGTFARFRAQCSARRKASEVCKDVCIVDGGIHSAGRRAWHVIAPLEIFAA